MKVNKTALIVCLMIIVSLAFITILPARDNRPAAGSEIAFNFVDVEIPTVIKFISEITGYNFIFDERIRGKITIIAPTKISIDESFSLFTSILSLKGYTIIETGFLTYKIIPSSLAKQQGKISTDEIIPVNEGYITKLIPTSHIEAEDALQFLRPIVSRDGHISSFGPRNLLLIVDSAVNISKVMSILKLIDKPSLKEEPAKINVYFLENANATDLAAVLQGIIKDLQTSHKTALRNKTAKNGANLPPILSVTPDKSTNSLIIVAPPEDYKNISSVIKTLDRRRKQVYVEAMIVEASIDKLKELGSRWRITASHNGEPVTIGGFGNITVDTIQTIAQGLSGLSAGGLGNFLNIPVTTVSTSGSVSSQTLTTPGFAALFGLTVFEDAINVLSTPQILTSDNEEAEIVVGENVPFISSRQNDSNTTTAILSSIQRTDVGITLRITPQITEGDYVNLNIYQEISALKDASDEVLTSVGPSTTKRSTKTSVTVKDGHTVVIGGLMEEREEEGTTKTPLLGDIPIIGWLFKYKTTSKNKKNLLVFLSPHVVKESPDLERITEQKHKSFVQREKLYDTNELLIKFKDNVSRERAREIIGHNGSVIIYYYKETGIYHIKLKEDYKIETAIDDYMSLSEVLYAEPNYIVKIPGIRRKIDDRQVHPFDGDDRSQNILHEQSLVPAVSEHKLKEDLSEVHQNIQRENVTHHEGTWTSSDSINEKPPTVLTVADTVIQDVTRNELPAPAVDINHEPVRTITNELHEREAPAVEPVELLNQNTVPVSEKVVIPDTVTKPLDDRKTSYNKDEIINNYVYREIEYYVQVGAWKNVKYAEAEWEQLIVDYPETYIVQENNFNVVRIPNIRSREQGQVLIQKLRNKFKLKPILVQSDYGY